MESTPGIGSCFSLVVPFGLPPAAHGPDPAAPRPAADEGGQPEATAARATLRVLLVEEDPSHLKLGALLLGRLGHDVVSARHRDACLAALESDAFDLVLLGLTEGATAPEEMLGRVKRARSSTGVRPRVIAVTSQVQEDERERFLRHGCDGHVSKPLVSTEVEAEVRRVMERALEEDQRDDHA